MYSSSTVVEVSRSSTGPQGYRNITGVQGTGIVQVCWGTVVVHWYRNFTGYRDTGVLVVYRRGKGQQD